MKLTSQRIGNVSLLLTINLVAFVILVNVLMFSFRTDLKGVNSSLTALSEEVNNKTTDTILPSETSSVSYFESTYFLTSAVQLPAQPAAVIPFLIAQINAISAHL